MNLLKIGTFVDTDAAALPHGLDVLLDDFTVQYVSLASLNYSMRDPSDQESTLHRLVENGTIDTIFHPVTPSTSFGNSFTFSNALGKSDTYMLYAKIHKKVNIPTGLFAWKKLNLI